MITIDEPSWVEIDLDRLDENLDLISRTAKTPLAPVIKANAYGHGAVALAKALTRRQDVVALAVGGFGEAVELRQAGIKGRIIVLDGIFPERAKDAVDMNLEVVISSFDQARELASHTGRKPARAHLKINTGMTRLGASPDEAFELFKQVNGLKNITLAGIMTHLADAYLQRGQAKRQISVFDDILSSIKGAGYSLPPASCANTAAIFLHPTSRYDLVRPGIGMYGAQEFAGPDVGLKQILSWRARIALTRRVVKGAPVSYGGVWTSPGTRRVAVVCAGYADGYSRRLSGLAHAIIAGRRIRQVGTICMDNCLFDITRATARVGDLVTLAGSDGDRAISIRDIARKLGSISYEVMCAISQRPPRIYIRNGKIDKRLTMSGHGRRV